MGRGNAVVKLANGRTPEKWAEIIRGKWQENVKSIFEVGLMLETSREELGAPAFWKMVRDELKWSKGTVSKLMTVADDDKLAEVSHGKLPASWPMLYQLTLLSPDEFETGLASGIIHADMERKDIALLKPPKPKPEKPASPANKNKPKSLLPRKESLVNEAFLLISTDLYDMPLQDQEETISELRLMLDQLEETVRFNRATKEAAE
jgi:hypothetical protein